MNNALDRPWLIAEHIIAKTIRVPAEEIWPSRYAKRNFTPVFAQPSQFPSQRSELREQDKS